MMNQKQECILSMLAYSLCVGASLFLNILTLSHLPFPCLFAVYGYVASIGIICRAHYTGYVSVAVDPIQQPWKFEYVKPFLLYSFFQWTTAYLDMRSHAVVSTVRLFALHTLTPLLVACGEALFLGRRREWPSTQSSILLLSLGVGVYSYARKDDRFQTLETMSAYLWPTLDAVNFALALACQKHVVHSVSPPLTYSGLVLYTSLLGILPSLCMAAMENEFSRRSGYWEGDNYRQPPGITAYVILLALVNTGRSYSGWWCLSLVSTTTYSMIRVMTRCLVLLSVLAMQDYPDTLTSIALLVSIAVGVVYLQSPMLSEKSVTGEEQQTSESTESKEKAE